ncbi:MULTISPECIES: TetR/AcrR family transcriptional regulator [unclassified Streptomyces]|uniref:TetR/AcrR family transcriptional regulator n=1 Tax=unclassified Streptomyces TaxID=2593676 RepID=UPI002DD9D424|nr:TetR/AcrR family transcriptional regulator [Streptomyces sp. NBC_00385]WRZ01958.1 TetR/AcrR family transcriptional regulator [Streptomyces sp. NBC_00385]
MESSARREDILQSALEVFAERGFKGASIDAVAERSGLTRQGVLHYFPSKRRLLLDLLDFREQLNREHLAGRRVGEDWAGDFAEAISFEQDHPSLATVHSVMVAEAVTGQEPAAGYVSERCRSLQDHLTRRMTQKYGQRLPSGLSAPTAAAAVLALVEGIHQMWLVDPDTAGRYPGVVREAVSVLIGAVDGVQLLEDQLPVVKG